MTARHNADQPQPKLVEVYVDAGYVCLQPAPADLPSMLQALRPLSLSRVRAERKGQCGIRATTEITPLFAERHDDVLVEAGLYRAAYGLLQVAGFELSSAPPRDGAVQCWPTWNSNNSCGEAIAAFANANKYGLLWLDSGVKLLTVLGFLIRMFPQARIVIATQHEDVARRIFEALCRRLPAGQMSYVEPGSGDDCRPRVYVGRYFYLGGLSNELIDLFIPIDVQHLLNEFHDGLTQFPYARTIGIDFASRKHTESERLWLGTRVGFRSLAIRHIGLRQRPVSVLLQPARIPTTAGQPPLSYENYRQTVVYNDNRNRVIATLARFMGGRLRAKPPRFAAPEIVEARLRRRGPRVVVVVDTVDHAVELARLLPTATLRFGAGADLEGLDARLPDICQRLTARLRTSSLVICTTAAVNAVAPHRFDAVIMASGRRELPPLLWRFAYTAGETARYPLTVIEIAGPRRRGQSTWSRLGEYAEHTRWRLENADQTELALFGLVNGDQRRRS